MTVVAIAVLRIGEAGMTLSDLETARDTVPIVVTAGAMSALAAGSLRKGRAPGKEGGDVTNATISVGNQGGETRKGVTAAKETVVDGELVPAKRIGSRPTTTDAIGQAGVGGLDPGHLSGEYAQ